MSSNVKRSLVALSLVLIIGSLIAWAATGMRGYTRFRDAEVEKTNQQSELGDLFAETGSETLPEVESTNSIGLLPSGPGRAGLSVATLGGAGVVLLGATFWIDRRKRKRAGS